jgi:hypothetical protein
MPGLGRRYAPDSRDADFPIRALLAAPSARQYRYWSDAGWWGDQGDQPHCVGYSWVHWVEDGPVGHAGPAPVINPSQLYRDAQRVDEWEGESYDGTSVRAGAKVLQAAGRVVAYHWASTIEEIVQAVLEEGPVVMGTNWYTGMFDTDAKGLMTISGSLAGGHAWIINGVNRRSGLFRMKNSWGREWGNNGRAWISIGHVARLLREEGEACLAVEAMD